MLYCKILENRESFKFVYEDELCFAILHESPSVPGHTLVIPKKHSPIFEELDDSSAAHLFVVGNNISSSLFDSLGAHGTNLLINNGVSAGQELPHIVLNVLPRKENDGLNLEWQSRKASNEELKTTQSMIRSYSESIFSGRELAKNVIIKKEEPILNNSSEDYMIKGLKRMP